MRVTYTVEELRGSKPVLTWIEDTLEAYFRTDHEKIVFGGGGYFPSRVGGVKITLPEEMT
jgi:hypothetical protein